MRDVADRAQGLRRAPGALSFAGYVPDGVLVTLAAAGAGATALSGAVVLAAVGAVLLVTVSGLLGASRRVRRQGGWDVRDGRGARGTGIVPAGLGERAGAAVAAAVLLTRLVAVAVCVSSASAYLLSLVPAAACGHAWALGHAGYVTGLAVAVVTLLALLSLRVGPHGGRRARQAYGGGPALGPVPGCGPGPALWPAPGSRQAPSARVVVVVLASLYVGVMGVMVVTGLVQELRGGLGRAGSADLEVLTAPGAAGGAAGLVVVLVVALRAFSAGGGALAGAEAVLSTVPTGAGGSGRRGLVLLLAGAGALILVAVVHLAGATGVQVAEDPATQLLHQGRPVGEGYYQAPVSVQVARALFPGSSLLPALVALSTGAVLLLAASTVIASTPVLAAALARGGLLPRRLAQAGDPVVRSQVTTLLWAAAVVLLIGSQALATRLLPLYVLGASFYLTLSQVGMVRHWTWGLTLATDPGKRQRMRRARVLCAVGATTTGLVLILVVATGLTRGVWVALVAGAAAYAVMLAILRHYQRAGRETALKSYHDVRLLPARVHAVVLASRFHQPTVRALTYAQSTHPASIEVLMVDMGDGAADSLVRTWEEAGVSVPLTVLSSPTVEVTRPVVSYVRTLRRDSPQDLVMVFLPENLAGHWWHRVLHGPTTRRLGSALRQVPGVVVTMVPWQLPAAHTGARGDAAALGAGAEGGAGSGGPGAGAPADVGGAVAGSDHGPGQPWEADGRAGAARSAGAAGPGPAHDAAHAADGVPGADGVADGVAGGVVDTDVAVRRTSRSRQRRQHRSG